LPASFAASVNFLYDRVTPVPRGREADLVGAEEGRQRLGRGPALVE